MLKHKQYEGASMDVKCCNTVMKKNLETAKFVELQCRVCGDVIYVKKETRAKPVMIDD